jgi:hypothetical protein
MALVDKDWGKCGESKWVRVRVRVSVRVSVRVCFCCLVCVFYLFFLSRGLLSRVRYLSVGKEMQSVHIAHLACEAVYEAHARVV